MMEYQTVVVEALALTTPWISPSGGSAFVTVKGNDGAEGSRTGNSDGGLALLRLVHHSAPNDHSLS